MDLSGFNLLEEKIRDLLQHINELRAENRKLKTDLEEGMSIETILNQKKRQQISEKVNGMLALLEEY